MHLVGMRYYQYNVEKLICKRGYSSQNPVYHAHIDEAFDIIKRANISTEHDGRDKMLKQLGPRYANVTREVVELFKSLCIECAKKRKRAAVKGVVIKPILSNDYGSRGLVDLIDVQSMPSGQQMDLSVPGSSDKIVSAAPTIIQACS